MMYLKIEGDQELETEVEKPQDLHKAQMKKEWEVAHTRKIIRENGQMREMTMKGIETVTEEVV
jgi:hypothetical protein